MAAALACCGNAFAQQASALDDYLAASQPAPRVGDGVAPVRATLLPASASQGALVIGRADPAATVTVDGRAVRVSDDGGFVFGIGRDATDEIVVVVRPPGTDAVEHRVAVTPRDWPVERIDGVPPKTVNPPPAIAARIAREQARVVAQRARDDARDDYEQAFTWPVRGRISGRFGNARVYNGVPKAGHSGMDIAAPAGTPVQAPAAGVVTFADPDLYLTGGTVLLDHGHGVSSNFLHLSRIDVKVGERVEQGQVIGAVGATGRATGPHLHWGMNWFDTRVDPLLVLERPR
ncbi:M23 family metallopeptidase [Cognatiluteimonas sedimenti]|uniref:M23 family metallopeptidase n=1 Tax=Cognatiluteimonas sedimenti TaxID=2927791 RepID=UPI003CCDACA3